MSQQKLKKRYNFENLGEGPFEVFECQMWEFLEDDISLGINLNGKFLKLVSESDIFLMGVFDMKY